MWSDCTPCCITAEVPAWQHVLLWWQLCHWKWRCKDIFDKAYLLLLTVTLVSSGWTQPSIWGIVTHLSNLHIKTVWGGEFPIVVFLSSKILNFQNGMILTIYLYKFAVLRWERNFATPLSRYILLYERVISLLHCKSSVFP